MIYFSCKGCNERRIEPVNCHSVCEKYQSELLAHRTQNRIEEEDSYIRRRYNKFDRVHYNQKYWSLK